jgi:hypothetical protein
MGALGVPTSLWGRLLLAIAYMVIMALNLFISPEKAASTSFNFLSKSDVRKSCALKIVWGNGYAPIIGMQVGFPGSKCPCIPYAPTSKRI